MKKIYIGDRITFKSACRWGHNTVTRVVIALDELHRPLVRYGGWSDFMVLPKEIKKVQRSKK